MAERTGFKVEDFLKTCTIGAALSGVPAMYNAVTETSYTVPLTNDTIASVPVFVGGHWKLIDRSKYQSAVETASVMADKRLVKALRQSVAEADRGEGRSLAELRARLRA